jgi:hypothetical protein
LGTIRRYGQHIVRSLFGEHPNSNLARKDLPYLTVELNSNPSSRW